jgi:hypothetical protein
MSEQPQPEPSPPILDEFSINEIRFWFLDTPCTKPMSKILEYLAEFEYDEKYESPFGGEPSYFPDDFLNSKVINQAIDYVYDRLKYG